MVSLDRERQLARAARLAGLAAPAVDAEARAAKAAAAVAPAITSSIAGAIAAAIGAEIEALKAPRREAERRQAALHEACRAVGAALDQLEQLKFTSREPAARMALERAARRLKHAMDKEAGSNG
jgi:hypothetical protein